MHVLLTGATGYLGRHLLARLLGDGHRVSVLVRPRRGQLQLRVVETLRPLPLPAGRPLPEIQVLAGDVAAPHCGLDAGALTSLRAAPPDAFVHAAGLTRFETHLAADIAHHNREGPRIAHALARDLGVARFVHLSTAYVAGTASAPFGAADLELGQDFHNPYEAQVGGVATLFQEIQEIPDLTVAENLYAGMEPRKHGFLIIHDFAYAQTSFDGFKPPSILEIDGAKDLACEFWTVTAVTAASA